MRGKTLAVIALGGGIGTIIRYRLTVDLAPTTPPDFDWVTLVINVVGSFALALVVTHTFTRDRTDLLRPFLAIGVIASFTTWAHLIIEIDQLVGAGQVGTAIATAGANLILGLLAAAAGALLGERSSNRQRRRTG